MSKQRSQSRPPRSAKVESPAVPRVPPPVTPAMDDRRAARLARQEQARAAAERHRRRILFRNGALAAGVILVVGGLLAAAVLREISKPGEAVGQQPSSHIASLTSPHAAYSTDPPTSGPHVGELPAWGVATTPVPKELQVHGLEDGAVIISYQPNLDTATVAQLTALTNSYSTRIVLTPESGLADPIILTAWGRLQRFPQYDEPGIRRFIDAFRGVDHHQDSGS